MSDTAPSTSAVAAHIQGRKRVTDEDFANAFFTLERLPDGSRPEEWVEVSLTLPSIGSWEEAVAREAVKNCQHFDSNQHADTEPMLFWIRIGEILFPAVVRVGLNPATKAVERIYPTKACLNLLHFRHGFEIPELSMTDRTMTVEGAVYGNEPPRIVISSIICSTLHKSLLTQKGKEMRTKDSRSRPTTAYMIGYFYVLNDFEQVHIMYEQMPDNGVHLEDDISAYPVENVPTATEEYSKNNIPKSECYAIIFMSMVCMVKAMANRKQYDEVFNKRVSALAYELDAMALEPASIKRVITYEVAGQLNKFGNFFPRLKTLLFSAIMEDEQIGTHARLILEDSQMNNFVLIHSFIGGTPKTGAHVDRDVLEELAKYYPKLTAIKKLYGGLWRYFKLFNPKNKDINNEQWPHLSAAAIAWGGTYGNESIFRMKLKNKNDLERYIKLSCQRLDPRAVFETQNTLVVNEEVRRYLLEQLGIRHVKPAIPISEISEFDSDKYQANVQIARRKADEMMSDIIQE